MDICLEKYKFYAAKIVIIPIRSKFLEESFQKRGIFGYYGTICEVIAAKLGRNKT